MDFEEVKEHDNWVRNYMYCDGLWDDPLYDLVEMPIRMPNVLIDLPNGVYAAGGYALYLSGYAKTHPSLDNIPRLFSDIDLFTTDIRTIEKFILARSKNGIANEHAITIPDIALYIRANAKVSYNTISCIQVVLRKYKAPTEIVHGFDLDCCGFILSCDDGTPRLWATKRAVWSVNNMTNVFDPSRASPSYAYRLSKYAHRGFKLVLPDFTPSPTLEANIDKLWRSILERFVQVASRRGAVDPCDIDEHEPVTDLDRIFKQIRTIADMLGTPLTEQCVINLMIMSMHMNQSVDIIKPWYQLRIMRTSLEHTEDDLKDLVPKDPASIVILTHQNHFYTSLWSSYDYNDTLNSMTSKLKHILNNAQWETIDPMKQLTGTFHPEPITDLGEWYKTSPLMA